MFPNTQIVNQTTLIVTWCNDDHVKYSENFFEYDKAYYIAYAALISISLAFTETNVNSHCDTMDTAGLVHRAVCLDVENAGLETIPVAVSSVYCV